MAVSAPSATQAAAVRLAQAQTLLLSVGQVVRAEVVGKTPAGLTTLKIGDQLVQAKLPQSLPPGTILQLAVKAGGATPQLVVIGQTLPRQAASAAPQPVAVTPLQLQPEVAVAGAPKAAVSLPTAGTPPAPPPIGEPVQRLAAQISQIESGARPAAQVAAARGSAISATPMAPVPAETIAQPGGQQVTAVARPAPQPGPGGPEATRATSAPQPAPPAIADGHAESPRPSGAASAQSQTSSSEIVRPAIPSSDVLLPASTAPSTPRPPVAVGAPSTPANQPAATQTAAGDQILSPGAGAASEPTTTAQSRAVQMPVAPEPEVSNPLLMAQSAVRPPPAMAAAPRPMPHAIVPGASASPAQPTTPQAALAQMMPVAMARQNSAGPLLMSLAAVVQKAGILPEPVLRAALGVLAQRIIVADGKVVAAELERAVARSGVYLEAALAKAMPQPADGKAALLNLREALGKWLGGTSTPPPPRDAAPPPLKGLPLRSPAVDAPVLPEAPRDLARALHGQADAAVSRTKLMQMASLPDADTTRPANNQVRMELPFLIGHELVMAQILIAREGTRREAERKRGWTMRFALNFSATGEVGAEVGLLGKAVNVALWAVEPETAEAMQAALPQLGAALEAVGLDPGAIRVRQGAPEAAKPVSGRLLDNVS